MLLHGSTFGTRSVVRTQVRIAHTDYSADTTAVFVVLTEPDLLIHAWVLNLGEISARRERSCSE
jgi:hypothetical protein